MERMTAHHSHWDEKAQQLAFAPLAERAHLAQQLRQAAQEAGVFLAPIDRVYRGLAAGSIEPLSVPAFNLRGLTYDIARAIWRVVRRTQAGPVIFELAPVEMRVSDQTFVEYAAMVLAAAVREGYQGPVFLQGDHFQMGTIGEMVDLWALCRDAVMAGFYQIDIDVSAMVDERQEEARAYQRPNARATAGLTVLLRALQPLGVSLVLGGEVGEIGGRNTSLQDLRAFLDEYREMLPPSIGGLDKVSAQTGTVHGGMVQADGTIGKMPLDFGLARRLSQTARTEYGLAGLVQHGASTLGLDDLARLPEAGVIEVHLATHIQNQVFDHPAFPADLLGTIRTALVTPAGGPEGNCHPEPKDLTDEQRFYQARWAAWGPFKQALWSMPEPARAQIMDSLEGWFAAVLRALRIEGRHEALESYMKDERGG